MRIYVRGRGTRSVVRPRFSVGIAGSTIPVVGLVVVARLHCRGQNVEDAKDIQRMGTVRGRESEARWVASLGNAPGDCTEPVFRHVTH